MTTPMSATLRCSLALVCAATALFAADGRWIAANGVWTNPANWAGSVVADGVGATAWFTNAIAADVSIFPYAPQTIGTIMVNDADGTGNAFSIRDGSNAFTIAGANPVLNCITRLNLLPVVYGTQGFTKIGAGILNIGLTSNFISGPVNLYQGSEIILNHFQALQNADVTVTGTLVKSQKMQLNAKSLTVGQNGKVDTFLTDTGANTTAVAIIVKDGITVNNGGQLGAGLADGVQGQPFALLSPSVIVNAGGQIRVNNNMAATSIAQAGISGSNIVVNSGGDIMFNAAGVYTLSNPLSLAGAGTYFNVGALLTLANGGGLTNDGPITLTGNTTIGQFGVGGYMVLNQPIGGTGNLILHAQAASWAHTKAFELFGSNTYNGTTKLSAFAASCAFGLHGPQLLPKTNFMMENNNWGGPCLMPLDLNGYDQTVGYSEFNGAGYKMLRSTGGVGTLTADNGAGYGIVVQGGGKLIIDSGVLTTPGYAVVRDNCELLVTGGTFYCGLELMLGHGGSTGVVTVAQRGAITNYVFRNGDESGGDEPSICNLDAGGTLAIAAMQAYAAGTPGAIAAGYLNFNGGTLSDGAWGEWNGSYADWIQVITNLVVKAGGARIEVNNTNGRGITKALLHDAALGGTADGGLLKLGAGPLTLHALCGYTGPTIVSNGLLRVHGGISASSGLNVASGAAIGGTGTLCSVTLAAGASIAPGASIGTLKTAAVTMQPGSLYDWEFGDDSLADRIAMTGALTLPGAANSVTVNAMRVGGSVQYATNTFVLATTGGISGGDANSILMLYTGGATGPAHPTVSGNNLTVTGVVPEPAALSLLALLALGSLRPRSGDCSAGLGC